MIIIQGCIYEDANLQHITHVQIDARGCAHFTIFFLHRYPEILYPDRHKHYFDDCFEAHCVREALCALVEANRK